MTADDDDKIIKFPSLAEREEKQKREEEEFRRQFRAQQKARKTPFINWDRIPPFTRITLSVFIIIHIIMAFAIDSIQRVDLIMKYGFIPAIYSGNMPWDWHALIGPFTTLLIHENWMHLLFNCIMMMVMGILCERQFGAKATAIAFLICGMTGNLAYVLLFPASTAPVIGASGAISGLFAIAFLSLIEQGMLGPETQRRGPMPFILLWCTLIIGLGFISANTAWQSHLGGFLGGIALVQLQKKRLIRLLK